MSSTSPPPYQPVTGELPSTEVTRPGLPHDPANGLTVKAAGNPCNRGCPGDWPCAERKSQRIESREVAEYLRNDLYKIVPSADDEPQEGNTWRSPLGWTVWLSYGERGLIGTIRTPDGKPHSSTTCASVWWLQADLP